MENEKNRGKSEKTKQFIIEKVAPVFNKKGFAGTSISDMTAVTGLSKGAIYGNFKNKDEIAILTFQYNLSMFTETISAEVDKVSSDSDKLVAFLNAYKTIYPKVISIGGCPILNLSIDSDDTHPVLREFAKRALDNMKNSVEVLINHGIHSGEIKRETNPIFISGLIVSLIEGGLLMSKTLEHDDYYQNALSHCIELIKDICI